MVKYDSFMYSLVKANLIKNHESLCLGCNLQSTSSNCVGLSCFITTSI